MNRGIGKRAVLEDGRCLQVGRPKVGQWVAAGIVVVLVPADECAEVEDRVVAYDPSLSGRDIKSADLGVLVGIAHIDESRIGAAAIVQAGGLNILDIQIVV